MKTQFTKTELEALTVQELEIHIAKLSKHVLAGTPNYCVAISELEEELERRGV